MYIYINFFYGKHALIYYMLHCINYMFIYSIVYTNCLRRVIIQDTVVERNKS